MAHSPKSNTYYSFTHRGCIVDLLPLVHSGVPCRIEVRMVVNMLDRWYLCWLRSCWCNMERNLFFDGGPSFAAVSPVIEDVWAVCRLAM